MATYTQQLATMQRLVNGLTRLQLGKLLAIPTLEREVRAMAWARLNTAFPADTCGDDNDPDTCDE